MLDILLFGFFLRNSPAPGYILTPRTNTGDPTMQGRTKFCVAIAMSALFLASCRPSDPRAPLDLASRNINDIQTYQLQAGNLGPLQEQLHQALNRDSAIRSSRVGLCFSASTDMNYGARLNVQCTILLEIKNGAMPSTQPSENDKFMQDIVRVALANCGWEVESIDTYNYENGWRIVGQIRGANKSPASGAGLEILPEPVSRP